jgi:Tfp pilus assembly protein FimV
MRFSFLTGTLFLLVSVTAQAAEPIVVLNYSQRGGGEELSGEAASHPFRIDPNYHQLHKVMQDETLGHIMQAYYGGSKLNMTFVELAIVQFNKHAFVRGNPNFLYANKTLHLPSVNQIKRLAIGKTDKPEQSDTYSGQQNEIFFFGG